MKEIAYIRADEVSRIYNLKPREQLTYLTLLQHMIPDRYEAQISNKEIATICNCSKSTIRNSIERLRDEDLVITIRRYDEKGSGMTNVYCLPMEFGNHKCKMQGKDKIEHINFVCDIWGENSRYYYGKDELVCDYEEIRVFKSIVNEINNNINAEELSFEDVCNMMVVAKSYGLSLIEYYNEKLGEVAEDMSLMSIEDLENYKTDIFLKK